MYITHLTQIGEIYQFLIDEYQSGKIIITIKNNGKVIFGEVPVKTKEMADKIYRYLLENWTTRKLQIFYKEDPAKNPVSRFG